MLNPAFAQAGWRPNATDTFACSSITNATGFNYVMSLVMSGRDPAQPRLLARQAEFDAFLITAESSAACKHVNSAGWTALHLAVRHAGTDSTDDTVAKLLAHESGNHTVHMRCNRGWTVLMMAARYSREESTNETIVRLLAHESSGKMARTQCNDGWTALGCAVCNSRTTSTDATVAQLLAHESSSDVARMRNHNNRQTLLMVAASYSHSSSTEETVAKLLEHESSHEVALMQDTDGHTALMFAIQNADAMTITRFLSHRSGTLALRMKDKHGLTALDYALTEKMQRLLVDKLLSTATEQEIETLCYSYSYRSLVASYFVNMRQRMQERQATVTALQAGLSLPGSIVLTYI
jgi:ankyrin repeat protein